MDISTKIETLLNGYDVIPYKEVVAMREEKSKTRIIAQKGGQENGLASSADIAIVGGNRGGGKGQSISDLVCTPFGFRKIGDLKIGDIITAIDGGMQKVIHIYELGERDLYKLKFSDGTSIDCTSDHIWKIKLTNRIHKRRHINDTGQDDDWELWTMEMIMNYLDRQERGEFKTKQPCRLLVPLCEPIKFTRSIPGWYKPKTDPYIMGVMLGDGCITESVMRGNVAGRFTTADKEVLQAFIDAGIDIRQSGCSGKLSEDYYLYDENLRNDLIELKLAGCNSATKFIPEIYKYAPLEQRWALVQGLMDTDGYIDSRGHCSYTTISKTLADDVAFVLRSLGAYVTITEKKAGYKKDGIYKECSLVYELYIKIRNSERLFRSPHRKKRCKPYNGGVSTPTKRIVGYEYVGVDRCRCIKVNHPSSLYITRDFTVTHNSAMLLMSILNYVYNSHLRGLILRNERDDLTDIVNKSQDFYSNFGEYKKSKDLMLWDFFAGGTLAFGFHAGTIQDFKVRFQGREYNIIGIDEITHILFDKFKYLLTTNRNSKGLRNQIIGTCNPDPDSWVARFIDWWIGEDGLPIPERNGVLRYCFMNGEDVTDIIWGDSPEDVYEQAKEIINPLLREGEDWHNYILSATFIRAELDDNLALLESDPTYKAKLAGQSEEQRQRDLQGNWKFKSTGDDLIKWSHMESFFNNPMQIGDGVKRVSCDVAFDGGDNLVMWLWVGNHIQDVFVSRQDSRRTVELVKAKLNDWGVREENFTYDLQGAGQTFKGWFKKAIPFNNQSPVDNDVKHLYYNLKSQAAYELAMDIIDGKISINPDLLDRKFGGLKYTVREILNIERKIIRRDDLLINKGWALIKKGVMKQLIGHSPDWFEGLIYKKIFDIKKTYKKPRGLGWL